MYLSLISFLAMMGFYQDTVSFETDYAAITEGMKVVIVTLIIKRCKLGVIKNVQGYMGLQMMLGWKKCLLSYEDLVVEWL